MMKVHNYTNSPLALLAYLVILIAGLKMASSLIVPLLMAFFWFLLFFPLVKKLHKHGISDLFTTLIVFGISLIILLFMSAFLVSSAQDLITNLPSYQEKLQGLTPKIETLLQTMGISLQKSDALSLFDPTKIISYTASFFKGMGDIMANSIITLLIVMFLFLESSLFSEKLFILIKSEESKEKIQLFMQNVNSYFLTKTFTSALVGLLIWGMLALFKLDYALLFGFLAFLLNFVPNIGSFLASLPALLLATLELGFIETSIIAAGYTLINVSIGNFLEPKIMGKRVGLSTFVVFISMFFWGWMFGSVGMFLSVPLTIVIKLAFDNSEKWQWIAVLLSDKISPPSQETPLE